MIIYCMCPVGLGKLLYGKELYAMHEKTYNAGSYKTRQSLMITGELKSLRSTNGLGNTACPEGISRRSLRGEGMR